VAEDDDGVDGFHGQPPCMRRSPRFGGNRPDLSTCYFTHIKLRV
jgi:hypothetical protein